MTECKSIKRTLFAYIAQVLRERNESYQWTHAYPADHDKTMVDVTLTIEQWAYFDL